MNALCRRPRIWIATGALAIFCAPACSLQDFDYLTRDQGAASSTGDGGGSPADATSRLDATGALDAPSSFDATGLDDAYDGATASDASNAQDSSMVGDSSDAATRATDGGSADATPEAAALDAGAREASGPVNYLVNPNFDGSRLNGWTTAPAGAAQTYAFTQAPVGSAYTPQGQAYELATYSASASFMVDISQTLTGLPDGLYTFAGWFNCGPNNTAEIYARNCWGGGNAPDGGVELTVPIPVTSATGWEQVVLVGIEVSGGSCQVGLYVDAAPTNWLNADGFTFEADTVDGGSGDSSTN